MKSLQKQLYFIISQKGYYQFFFNHYNIPDNIIIIPDYLQHPKDFVRKIIHKLLLHYLPIRSLSYIYPKFSFNDITNLEGESTLLTIDITNPNTLYMLRRVIPKNVVFYNHLQNPIKNNAPLLQNIRVIERLKKKGINLTTFDKADAEKYHITLKEQFYCHISQKELNEKTEFDFFFCGLAKDRKEEILELTNALQKMGYSCKVIIPESPSERLSCEQYIQLLKRCRCLIDINQREQVGLSRRPLEALFFKKKLISNNPIITSYDFYHEDNIFDIASKQIEDIPEFLNKPMVDVPPSILDKYTIDHWLQQFIE